MIVKYRTEKPEKMDFTLTITMSLGEWQQIAEQMINGKWPTCDLKNAIQDVVYQANKTFAPKVEREAS